MAFNGYNGYNHNLYYGDSSSDDSVDGNNDECYESEEDYFVKCLYCPSEVKKSNYDWHMKKVHTCEECGNKMPRQSLKAHKERNHMEVCKTCKIQMLATPMKQHLMTHYKNCQYCNSSVHQQALEKHIHDNHPFHSTLGMIRLEKITDDEFNKLVAQNRISSKDGHLFKRL